MAKWKIKNNSVNNTLTGSFEYEGAVGESIWSVHQDERPFIEQAKIDRETQRGNGSHYKKFASIPEIVAIELNTKYGIDIHSPTFMHDTDMKARMMAIIKQDFPYLLSYD